MQLESHVIRLNSSQFYILDFQPILAIPFHGHILRLVIANKGNTS